VRTSWNRFSTLRFDIPRASTRTCRKRSQGSGATSEKMRIGHRRHPRTLSPRLRW